MAATLSVPDSRLEQVRGFLQKEEVDLEVVAGGEGTVVIQESEERQEGTVEVLYMGGWVSCVVAWAAAEKLGAEHRSFGRLLDVLDIRIRDCQLGCF